MIKFVSCNYKCNIELAAKTLLLSLLRKMRSNITYMYGHHLNNHKNAPLRVHHVDSEDSVISSAFPASCNRLFLDATFFLKQNTIYHNSVKVSDPTYRYGTDGLEDNHTECVTGLKDSVL